MANDIAVNMPGEASICAGDETPITVQLTNLGSEVFLAGSAIGLTVVMEIDGEAVLSSDWSGELGTYQSTEFTLGSYAFEEETTFTVRALASDENATNDAIDATVEVSEEATSEWLITLLTDSWGGETGWEVRNAFGLIVAAALPGSYDNETLYEIPVTIPSDGCHTFTLIDTYGDGMNGGSWGGSNGTCTVQSLDDTGSPMNAFFDYNGSYVFDEIETLVSVTTTVDVAQFEQTDCPFNPSLRMGSRSGVNAYSEWQVFNALGVCTARGRWNGTQQWLDTNDWPTGALVLVLTGPTAHTAIPLLKR